MYFVKKAEASTQIEGVKRLVLDTFSDSRGEIWTLYTDCDFLPTFVEDKLSVSKKHVLRGLHGDSEIDKLITCVHGEIQLAVVDFRQNSPTYGKSQMFKVGEKNPVSVFVPAGCVNGHLCLSDKCIFYYKWSKPYNGAENQVTVQWNDPALNLEWEINDPIVSERDKNHAITSEGVRL